MSSAVPDPGEKDLESLLADPELRAKIDDRVQRLKVGELPTVDHQTALERLARHGKMSEVARSAVDDDGLFTTGVPWDLP